MNKSMLLQFYLASTCILHAWNGFATVPSLEKDTLGKVSQLITHTPKVMNVFDAQAQGFGAIHGVELFNGYGSKASTIRHNRP